MAYLRLQVGPAQHWGKQKKLLNTKPPADGGEPWLIRSISLYLDRSDRVRHGLPLASQGTTAKRRRPR
jgi:hypothetical protein